MTKGQRHHDLHLFMPSCPLVCRHSSGEEDAVVEEWGGDAEVVKPASHQFLMPGVAYFEYFAYFAYSANFLYFANLLGGEAC